MERAQATQGMPSGGDSDEGGGPGGRAGATPGDVHEQAKALAEQLLFSTPETMRRGELIKIKHSNPTLHALVTQQMDEMRSSMASQGKAMMMEQAKQGSFGPKNNLSDAAILGIIVYDQINSYNEDDLTKIAADVRAGTPGATQAFRYVYDNLSGIIRSKSERI